MASSQTQRVGFLLELDDRLSSVLAKPQQALSQFESAWRRTQKVIDSMGKQTVGVQLQGKDNISPVIRRLQEQLGKLSALKADPTVKLGGGLQKALQKGLDEAAGWVADNGQKKLQEAFTQLAGGSEAALRDRFGKLAREAGKLAAEVAKQATGIDVLGDVAGRAGSPAAAGKSGKASGKGKRGGKQGASGASAGASAAAAGGAAGGKVSQAIGMAKDAWARTGQAKQEMSSPETMISSMADVFHSSKKGERVKNMSQKAGGWAGMTAGKSLGEEVGRKLAGWIPGIGEEAAAEWGGKIGEAGGLLGGELLIGKLFEGGGGGDAHAESKQGAGGKGGKGGQGGKGKKGGKGAKGAAAAVTNAAKAAGGKGASMMGGLLSAVSKGATGLGKLARSISMPLDVLDGTKSLFGGGGLFEGGENEEDASADGRKETGGKGKKGAKRAEGEKSGGQHGKSGKSSHLGKGAKGAAAAVTNAAKAAGGKGASMMGGLLSTVSKGATGLGKLALRKITMPLEMLNDAKSLMDASPDELPQKAAGTAGKWGGTLAGAQGGAALGAMIGSIVPGIGTAIGGAAGGMIGGIAGSSAGEWLGDKLGGMFGGSDKAGDGEAGRPAKEKAAGGKSRAKDKAKGPGGKTGGNKGGKTGGSAASKAKEAADRASGKEGAGYSIAGALDKLSGAASWVKDRYNPKVAQELGGSLLDMAKADTTAEAAALGGAAGSKLGGKYGAHYGGALGARFGQNIGLTQKEGAAAGQWLGDKLGKLGGGKAGQFIGESIGKLNDKLGAGWKSIKNEALSFVSFGDGSGGEAKESRSGETKGGAKDAVKSALARLKGRINLPGAAGLLSGAAAWARTNYDPKLAKEIGRDLLGMANAGSGDEAAMLGGAAGTKYGTRYGARYGGMLGAKIGRHFGIGGERGAAIGEWVGDKLGGLGGDKAGQLVGDAIGKLNIPEWKKRATEWLSELPGTVRTKLSEMMGMTLQELGQLPGMFADWWGQAQSSALTALADLPANIGVFFGQLPDILIQHVQKSLEGYISIGRTIGEALFSGVTKMAEGLGAAGKWAMDKLTGGSGGPKDGQPSENGGKVAAYARGGIITRPHLGLVAEAGPEAVIPLSPPMRDRAVGLWHEAGRYLGMQPFQPAIAGMPGLSAGGAIASAAGGSSPINVNVGGVTVQFADAGAGDEEMALRIGQEIVRNIRSALENRV